MQVLNRRNEHKGFVAHELMRNRAACGCSAKSICVIFVSSERFCSEHLRFLPDALVIFSLKRADVAELADALDSKSSTGNSVWVRPPPSAGYVIKWGAAYFLLVLVPN